MNIVILNYNEGTVDYLKNISDNLNDTSEIEKLLTSLRYNLDEISYMCSDNIRVREFSFLNKDSDEDYFVCNECGGRNIQIRGWVDPNTNEYISDCDDDECWCEDCDKETNYIRENEYRSSSI